MYNKLISKLTKVGLLTTSLILSGCGDSEQSTPPIDKTYLNEQVGALADGELSEHIESIRRTYDLPAIATLMLKDGEIVDIAVTGQRVYGQPELATLEDRWVIGSFTKSMTATLAARLVEQGFISYETTVIDIFPEMEGRISEDHKTITLKQLLSMTSGLKREEDTSYEVWKQSADSLVEQRNIYALSILNSEAKNDKGQFFYSNAGYVVAGHMLETVTGLPWEDLIANEVFNPLGVTNYGFGPPNIEDPENQLSGHKYTNGSWQAVNTMEDAFIPLVLGPAGQVNMGLHDLATYMQAHMNGMRGEENILTLDSYANLHTPLVSTDSDHRGYGSHYAMGWFYSINDKSYRHGGGTALFTIENLLLPEENIAFLAVTNNGASSAGEALFKAIDVMIRRYRASLN